MITYLYFEQLQERFPKKLYYCYILFGDNEFLLQDNTKFILKYIQVTQVYEYFNFAIDNKLSWKKVFDAYQTNNLFHYKKKIFLLTESKEKFNYFTLKKLFSTINFPNKNLLLILNINKLTSTLKKFFETQHNDYKKYISIIDCNLPTSRRLPLWIKTRTKNLQITLDELSCDLLCTHYKYDLNGLNQILYQLSIIYPQKYLNIKDIQNFINNTSPYSNLSDLLESILQGNKKQSKNILHELKINNIIQAHTILRFIQYTILFLIILKRNSSNNKQFTTWFNKYKIPKNQHLLYIQSSIQLTIEQLYQSLTLLVQMELNIYQEYENIIWKNFELLIWLLCNNKNNTLNKY